MYNSKMIIKFYMVWILTFCSNVYADSDTWANNAQTNKSYYVHDLLKNWNDAQAACEARGSRLAVITVEIDLTFIRNLRDRKTEQYWIGLKKEIEGCGCMGSEQSPCVESDECHACRKPWVWVDNTQMGTYLPWGCNRPLADNRTCGVIRRLAFAWDGTNCENLRRSVCQYDCSDVGCKRTECQMKDIYSCICDAGYTGQHCDQDMDECSPGPCLHGGTCVNGINRYTCLCVDGYTGVNCEEDIDYCDPDPCVNAVRCIDNINSFTCICNAGFTDQKCDSEIDECSSNPCQHGGICKDKIARYECNCTENYNGVNCQIGQVISASSETETDDPAVQNAFYAGVAFLAVAFVGMIITIVIFIKTKHEASEPVLSSGPKRDGIENVGSDDAGASGNSI